MGGLVCWILICVIFLNRGKPNLNNGFAVDNTLCSKEKCDFCEHDFTIVLALERSGSTTTMNMILSLSNVQKYLERDGQLGPIEDM
mmetsp:Transcript_10101/g.18202  ORF Transcript_10101/g.18202 Transcript_10101/m.18202 type:complete len:86 (-) Transcript_10101:1381-1638(-)